MSDDLVKSLHTTAESLEEWVQKYTGIKKKNTEAKLMLEAADRIEELEAENRLLQDAVYIDDLTVTMQANDRSKALAGIRRALCFLNADMPTEAKTALCTTLAELTGGKDE